MSIGLSTMAKKRPTIRPARYKPRKQIFGLRASEEYKDWLVRFALHLRKDMADLVDDALAGHAKSSEFEPPPRR